MTDHQVRQLAEQLAKLHTFVPGNGGWGKRCAKCGETENFKDHRSAEVVIGTALAAFAFHTRREALREAASLTCSCCAIDGDPEDWSNKSTATPAGDDGGPRFVHVYPDGTTIECGTQEIWAAIRLLAEESNV